MHTTYQTLSLWAARLFQAGELDPNASSTTAAGVAATAGKDPGAALGSIGTSILNLIRSAAWPFVLVGLAVGGIALILKRDRRLAIIGLAVGSLGLIMLVFKTETVGALLKGGIDAVFS